MTEKQQQRKEIYNQIKTLQAEGLSPTDVQEQLGISKDTYYYTLNRFDVNTGRNQQRFERYEKQRQEMYNEIKALQAQGLRPIDIQKRLDIGKRTYYYTLECFEQKPQEIKKGFYNWVLPY